MKEEGTQIVKERGRRIHKWTLLCREGEKKKPGVEGRGGSNKVEKEHVEKL